mgnify:CR=1 FL=1
MGISSHHLEGQSGQLGIYSDQCRRQRGLRFYQNQEQDGKIRSYINYESGPNGRVTSVTDDSNPANTLLTFTYSNGYLSQVTDAYGRKVTYSYLTGKFGGDQQSEDRTCLHTVSQVTETATSNPPARVTYGYDRFAGNAHWHPATSPNGVKHGWHPLPTPKDLGLE